MDLPPNNPTGFGAVGMSMHYPPVPGMDLSGNPPDLLGDGLDDLLPGVSLKSVPQASSTDAVASSSTPDALADLFGSVGVSDVRSSASTGPMMLMKNYIPAPQIWLESAKGKGLEIAGTFSLAGNQVRMELTFNNQALSPMTGFAIQFNKNSFGLAPAQPLSVPSPLQPHQSAKVILPLNFSAPVFKMEPLMNLQMAVKNNVDVFYFACLVPIHVLFVQDGEMEKLVFLATWKDIPAENEEQFSLPPLSFDADECSQKLRNNNVFTIAKRNVDGQDMLYQSIKLCNGIWVLAELKVQPGNPIFTLSLKSRAMDVHPYVKEVFYNILSK